MLPRYRSLRDSVITTDNSSSAHSSALLGSSLAVSVICWPHCSVDLLCLSLCEKCGWWQHHSDLSMEGKRRYERGLCHHVGVTRNPLLLTCIAWDGLILRSVHLMYDLCLTVYFGKLKIICGVTCLRNVNTRVGDKLILDGHVWVVSYFGRLIQRRWTKQVKFLEGMI
jgi:hypothetical protein